MTALTHYDAACRAIAEAKRVDEVKNIRDRAEALRVYGRVAKNRDLEMDAAEIRMRAERRLGEKLTEGKAEGTIGEGRPWPVSAPENNGAGAELLVSSNTAPPRSALATRVTLAELGIDKKLSARSQRIAAVPEERFEAEIARWREQTKHGRDRVILPIIRAEERARRRAEREANLFNGGNVDDLHALITSGWKAGAILVDPPWAFQTYSDAGQGRSPSMHHGPQELAEISALPIVQLAAADAALFLWIPSWRRRRR